MRSAGGVRGWIAALAAALVPACAATSSVDQRGAGGGSGAPDASAPDVSEEAEPAEASIPLDADDQGCATPCSADLRDVLDCDGHVKKTCSPDEACWNGKCLPNPCRIAADAKTSYGCEFYALSLINFPAGACWATYVANVWPVPVKIQVDFGGTPLPVADFARIPTGQGASITYAPYDEAKGLGPGEVAVLFMSQAGQAPPLGVPCPPGVGTALDFDPTVQGTGYGLAFHITTDRPVAAYEISPYGGGQAARTYATLLLPTGAWDTNYLAVNADKQDLGPTTAILAKEDGTSVTIAPKAGITAANGVAGAAPGQPVTYTLNRGQYVQISELTGEQTGSPILADKPVAVFGGNPCIGIGACCCDNAAQMIPPVRALGHEYAGVRYRSRAGSADEVVPWRLVGAVDATVLTWTPSAPPGAPPFLLAGQVVDFQAPGPFLVASQDADHPFYMAQYMSGGGSYGGEGDPEFVNVVPTAQYLNSYVFFTDPTYSETELVIVRTRNGGAFQDVTLDCAGPLTGWQPLGPYEWTRVDLVTGDFAAVGGCSNGRHEIRSGAPFGATVWGWGSAKASVCTQYVSYAYPAGVGVAQLSQTVVPPTPH